MKEERTQTDVMLVIADILASVSDVGTADKIKSLRCKITQNVKDKRNFMNYMLEHVTRMGYELRCLTNRLGITGKQLHPDYCEALMGWPIGWTELNALGMDKFQQWLNSHGIS